MFVAAFSKTFVAEQAIGQLVPSKYLVPEQERHWVLLGPEHVAHSVWQESQVLVELFANFPEGQLSKH